MRIELDHFIVSARDRRAAGERLASLLGVPCGEAALGPFFAVYLNDGLTLDFLETDEAFPVEHYCFRVSDTAFDAILERLRAAGIAYRSSVHGDNDGQVSTAFGGRGVYWNDPERHQWELLTVSYARPLASAPTAELAVRTREQAHEAVASACPFCRIAADPRAGAAILQSELAIAFLDIRPIRPGHVLVVPRRHEADFWQLSVAEQDAMFALARQVSAAQRALFDPPKLGMLVAGFEVPHAHLHVLPLHDTHDLTSEALLQGRLKPASAAALADCRERYAAHFLAQA